MKVRVIFTKCVQDGRDHYSQKWWTTDIPVPKGMEHELDWCGSDIAGVEIVKE